MKPTGRALEVVAVGLGQGGGNLASEFHRRGYRALALNTAHTDLSALSADNELALPRDYHLYIGIDGYDGAGSDLNYGRECIRKHADEIREAVRSRANAADIVLITAGLGGGTGSAVSELITILSDISIPLVAMVTLPNETESGIAKVNAVRGVNALVKARQLSWIFLDNARLSESHRDVAMAHYYEAVNGMAVEPLDAFLRLNDREGVTPIRSFDGEDFRTLLLSGGVMNYATMELEELSPEAVLGAIRENLQNSRIMPSGFALDQISHLAVVIEASSISLETAPFSLFEEISSQLKDETGGAAVSIGIYRIKRENASAATLRVFCSSQALPDGLQSVLFDAKREGGALRDKLSQSIASLDLGEIEAFDLFRTTVRTSPPPPVSGTEPKGLGELDDEELAVPMPGRSHTSRS